MAVLNWFRRWTFHVLNSTYTGGLMKSLGFELGLSLLTIGPLHKPVTWHGLNYAVAKITRWEFENKGTSTSPARLFFVLKAALCNFASQHNLFRTMWPPRAMGPFVSFRVPLYYNKNDDIIKDAITNNTNNNHFKPTKHIYEEVYHSNSETRVTHTTKLF